ncbi:MAG: hypothetical protein ACRD68_17640, partial [Pyrinomonadaceae bacterium]
MKTLLLIACLALLTIAPTQNKTQIRGLPAGALIVETRPLNAEGRADRALVLWMLRPSKNPRATHDDQYTCPEETRGHYYSGPTRVSLIDTAARRVINTVKITPDAEQDS